MTSLEVIDTDAFLDMPVSSQLLYFHLNARADDDGFVANPKKIARMLNAGSDDMKVLIGKKFLIAFEDGVCIIKHWRINNFIRKDIYKETKYLDLKSTLFIRANGAYTQTDDRRSVALPKGHFQLEDVNDTLTERQLRIGKVRIGKVRLDKDSKVEKKEPYGEFQNVFLLPEEYLKLVDQFSENNARALIEELSSYIESSGKRYKSHYATLLNWARRKIKEHHKEENRQQKYLPNKSTADFSK